MNLPAGVETIIGLEVHVQLQTDSKLFCRCSTRFGQPPNTQTCPVCTGMPGTLPVVNERALRLSIKTGLALDCKIAEQTRWDRKHYFYPDLPKGYQISQLDFPVCGPGRLFISDPKGQFEPATIELTRAHLEEDAGKSIHDLAPQPKPTRIDFNRAGTPLLEIVTEPDLRSGAQAKAFLIELKLLLSFLEVSDCNMQNGNLRVDANINLHLDDNGERVATPIVEIKNLNSFRAVERALNYETTRQWEAWDTTRQRLGSVPKSTRGWDDQNQQTIPQREKEESADYRYFPDPDLPWFHISPHLLEQLTAEMPELPATMRNRLRSEYGLSDYDANVLVGQGRGLVEYFEAVARQTQNFKQTANWVSQDVLRHLNEKETTIELYPVGASQLAELIAMVTDRRLDHSRAKEVLEDLIAHPGSIIASVQRLGIRALGSAELAELCERILKDHSKIVNQIRDGNEKAVGALIGAAKKIEPNVDAGLVRKLLLEQIREKK